MKEKKRDLKWIKAMNILSASSNTKTAGITLISLVTTIIVLLILAGVSVATLDGKNGMLEQVNEAKNKTEEADLIEKIRVEVVRIYGIDGNLDDIDKLNEALKKINGLTYNGNNFSYDNKIESLPAIVGDNILIEQDGEVRKVPEIIAKILVNPTEYYGKKVTNYKANENDTNTYRIFYVDKKNDFGDGANTIYLKADYSSVGYSYKDYANYDSANTKVRIMNPKWAEVREEYEFDANHNVTWYINEQAAAYLCSPVNDITYTNSSSLPWKDYYNSEYANYVIGGPSVEMYLKSYNEAHKDQTPIGVNYTTGYIYVYNNNQVYITDMYSIDFANYNSMYCGKDGTAYRTGNWWLASPSAGSSNNLCFVNGPNGALFHYDGINNYFGISPLVCLKSSFIPELE